MTAPHPVPPPLNTRAQSAPGTRRARAAASIVCAATVFSTGFFAASGLLDPGGLVPGGNTHAARIYASYMAARSIVLIGALLAAMATRAWRSLALVMLLNAAVQLLDAVNSVAQGHTLESGAPVAFGVALLGTAWWLSHTNLTSPAR